MDGARMRAELTVQGLWLIPLEVFQQDVLAQSLNEALEERYRGARIPLSTPAPGDSDDHVRRLAEQLLQDRAPGFHQKLDTLVDATW
jgi:hypothetical protein